MPNLKQRIFGSFANTNTEEVTECNSYVYYDENGSLIEFDHDDDDESSTSDTPISYEDEDDDTYSKAKDKIKGLKIDTETDIKKSKSLPSGQVKPQISPLTIGSGTLKHWRRNHLLSKKLLDEHSSWLNDDENTLLEKIEKGEPGRKVSHPIQNGGDNRGKPNTKTKPQESRENHDVRDDIAPDKNRTEGKREERTNMNHSSPAPTSLSTLNQNQNRKVFFSSGYENLDRESHSKNAISMLSASTTFSDGDEYEWNLQSKKFKKKPLNSVSVDETIKTENRPIDILDTEQPATKEVPHIKSWYEQMGLEPQSPNIKPAKSPRKSKNESSNKKNKKQHAEEQQQQLSSPTKNIFSQYMNPCLNLAEDFLRGGSSRSETTSTTDNLNPCRPRRRYDLTTLKSPSALDQEIKRIKSTYSPRVGQVNHTPDRRNMSPQPTNVEQKVSKRAETPVQTNRSRPDPTEVMNKLKMQEQIETIQSLEKALKAQLEHQDKLKASKIEMEYNLEQKENTLTKMKEEFMSTTKDIRVELDTLQNENQGLKLKLTEINQLNESQIQQLKNQSDSLQHEEVQKEHSSYDKKENNNIAAAFSRAEQTILLLQESNKSEVKKNKSLQKIVKKQSKIIKALESDSEKLKGTLEDSFGNFKYAKESLELLRKEKDVNQSSLNQFQQKSETLEAEVNKAGETTNQIFQQMKDFVSSSRYGPPNVSLPPETAGTVSHQLDILNEFVREVLSNLNKKHDQLQNDKEKNLQNLLNESNLKERQLLEELEMSRKRVVSLELSEKELQAKNIALVHNLNESSERASLLHDQEAILLSRQQLQSEVTELKAELVHAQKQAVCVPSLRALVQEHESTIESLKKDSADTIETQKIESRKEFSEREQLYLREKRDLKEKLKETKECLSEISKKLQKKESEATVYKEKFRVSQESSKSYDMIGSELREELKKAHTNYLKAEAQRKDLDMRLSNKEKELQKLKESFNKTQEQRDSLHSEMKSRKKKMRKLEQDGTRLMDSEHRLKEYETLIMSLKREGETYRDESRSLLDTVQTEAQRKIVHVEEDLLKSQKELQEALSEKISLSHALNNLKVDADKVHELEKVIEKQRKSDKDHSTKIRKLETQIESLLTLKSTLEMRLQTQNESLEKEKSFAKDLQKHLYQYKDKMSKLEVQLSSREKYHKSIEDRNAELEPQIDRLQNLVDEKDQYLKEYAGKLMKLESKVKSLNRKNVSRTEEKESLISQVEELQAVVEKSKSKNMRTEYLEHELRRADAALCKSEADLAHQEMIHSLEKEKYKSLINNLEEELKNPDLMKSPRSMKRSFEKFTTTALDKAFISLDRKLIDSSPKSAMEKKEQRSPSKVQEKDRKKILAHARSILKKKEDRDTLPTTAVEELL